MGRIVRRITDLTDLTILTSHPAKSSSISSFRVRFPFLTSQISAPKPFGGGVASFWGHETIHEDGRLVYTARYGGGLVDRRSGD